ncbi:SRPBCC domain-containing protein [Streptomyces sp. NPDC000410]|uniref:SRPBCC domain-containing protein n=1 Tax=Streptomyces sp. NPDC000410 TaxID=3154254 RepID=UPI003328053F
MEHEVFVPVPAEALRQTLSDPARLARCVPGLQQDADAEAGPLVGRLKVRVGGHTITYRGALRIAEQDGGDFAVEGEGTEARGSGAAKLALTIRLTPVEEGTTVGFTGTAHAEGRLAEADPDAVTQAATRLLSRFASSLANEAATEEPEEPEEAYEEADEDEVVVSVFDVDVPPSALDPLVDDEPPAEAAHARRTMIGRSAEEVDHAPPRGRYAPVPPPQATTAGGTLRWIAPAAAIAIASAVVVSRALRRRK